MEMDDEDMANNSSASKGDVSKLMVDLNKRELEKFFNLDKKTRTALSVSALALLLFVGVGFFSPFKDRLFNSVYQKPASNASTGQESWKSYTANQNNLTFKYPGDYRAVTTPDQSIILLSPDAQMEKDGMVSEGIKVTFSVLTDQQKIASESAMLTPQKGQTSAASEFPNLIPPNFNAPTNSQASAYRMYNSSRMVESVVNITQTDKSKLIHVSCVDPGRMGQCASLLPMIMSTLKVN